MFLNPQRTKFLRGWSTLSTLASVLCLKLVYGWLQLVDICFICFIVTYVLCLKLVYGWLQLVDICFICFIVFCHFGTTDVLTNYN